MSGSKKDVANDTTPLAVAYDKVSDRVVTAYSAARDKASEAATGAVEGIDASPVAALLGGLAIGVIAGALIPVIAREKDLLAPLGGRIAEAGQAAMDAAKSAGSESLGDAGFSADNLRGQASKLFEQLIQAASAAGAAAVAAARKG